MFHAEEEGRPPRWHDPARYEARECWPRRNWGWEFLRRHPGFRAQWQKNVSAFRPDTDQPYVIRSSLRGCIAPFDCLYADTPDRDAQTARVFWAPEASPRVLPMRAVATDSDDEGAILRLADLKLTATVLLTPDGKQHLLLQDGPRNLQLAVQGADLLRPVRLYPEPPAGRDVKSYWTSLHSWIDFWNSGLLCAQHFPPDRRHLRLHFIVTALDGWQAYIPQREIATALYGPARVEAEWSDPQGALRDGVRHAIRRGRQLMDDGQRQFLR